MIKGVQPKELAKMAQEHKTAEANKEAGKQMTDELIEMAQGQGCSPAFVEFKQLPVTCSLCIGGRVGNYRPTTSPNLTTRQMTEMTLTLQ